MLILTVDQEQKAAIVVAEGFMLTAPLDRHLDMSGQFQTVLPANRVGKGFRQVDNVCYATGYDS